MSNERTLEISPDLEREKIALSAPFPDEISKRYYIINETVYADAKQEKELFKDNGETLKAKEPDAKTIALMLDVAKHRGWDTIKVSGNKDFRRDAWLEGSIKGINIKGYEPSPLDKQELERRLVRENSRSQENQPKEQKTQQQKTQKPDLSVKGVILEMGIRPYRDNENATKTPFVTVKQEDGTSRTLWGAGLKSALEKSDAKKGDFAHIAEAGKENVTVKGRDGNDMNIERRAWSVELDNSRTIAAAAPTIRHEQNGAGISEANKRAEAYLKGETPEMDKSLRTAVAIEKVAEAKLKEKFPNNPAVVAQGLEAARSSIADRIREGAEFSKIEPQKETKQEQPKEQTKERKSFELER